MFIILKDVGAMNEYAEAGLLWWVHKVDGGRSALVHTTPYIHKWPLDDAYIGFVGIHVEE